MANELGVCDGTLAGIYTAAPTNGQTVSPSYTAVDGLVAITPAGTLATLTVALPSTPRTLQRVTISTTQIVTALTITGAHTILATVTTLALGGFCTFQFDGTIWRRIA